MKVIINNKEYILKIAFKDNDNLREAFNNLTQRVFGFSFEQWYQAGYWNEKYIPYTLFDGNLAVANASVNIIDFDIFNKPKRFIQVGTVMTDKSYRGRGLSRFLIKKIMADWDSQCDLIYLYANESTIGFYPRLGFEAVKEYECFKNVKKNEYSSDLQKLDMDKQENRDLVYNYIKQSDSFSSFSNNKNADLAMFYCIFVLKDYVYFSRSLDIVAIFKMNGIKVHLWGVFGNSQIELEDIISHIPNAENVLLGFTPNNTEKYKIREITGSDVLFFQKGKTKLFEENKLMFPLLSHA